MGHTNSHFLARFYKKHTNRNQKIQECLKQVLVSGFLNKKLFSLDWKKSEIIFNTRGRIGRNIFFPRRPIQPRIDCLCPRERDVNNLLALCWSCGDLASFLGLASHRRRGTVWAARCGAPCPPRRNRPRGGGRWRRRQEHVRPEGNLVSDT